MTLALDNFWRRLAHTRLQDALRGRIDGALDWQAEIERSGLPESLQACVEEVARRTRWWGGRWVGGWVGGEGLWKQEQREVAGELVAHFQDGLAAGASEEQLLEAFGDPRQAARLIRRAKLRCRPLWWHAWWWSPRLLLAAFVAYILYGVFLLTGRATITTDYVAQLNAPIVNAREEDKAWPLYREAILLLNERLPIAPESDLQSRPHLALPLRRLSQRFFTESYGNLTPDLRGELDAWLDDNQDLVELFRRGAAKPTLGLGVGSPTSFPRDAVVLLGLGNPEWKPDPDDPWEGSLTGSLLPHHELMDAARLLERDCQHAVAEQDEQRALADITAILGLAHQVEEPRLFINYQIRRQFHRVARRQIEHLLKASPNTLSAQQWAAIAHALSRPERGPSHFLRGELEMALDLIQRSYTDDGSGNGQLTPQSIATFGRDMGIDRDTVNAVSTEHFLSPLAMPRAVAQVRSRKDEASFAQQYHQASAAAVSQPLWTQPDYPDEWLIEDQPGVAQMCFVSSSWVAQAWNRERGEIDGLLIAIALELFKRENQHWPDTLAELSPRWLPQQPVDLINGGPLGYRLVDGQPVVYSLGIDGDDDGGRLPTSMNDLEMIRQGMSTTDSYNVGPPLTEEERSSYERWNTRRNPTYYDGDWVLWSLAEPRHMPVEEPTAGQL